MKEKKVFEKQASIYEIEDDTFTFIASKEIVDRDGDIVYIDGLDTKNFEKNPVILYMHDMSKPVGKAVAIEKGVHEGKKTLYAKIKFADTPTGNEIKQLYNEGILNAVSIRFIPEEYKEVKREEMNDITFIGWDVLKSELLEISAVTIPANQEALIQKVLELKKKVEHTEQTLNNHTLILSELKNLKNHIGNNEKSIYETLVNFNKIIKGEKNDRDGKRNKSNS